MERRSNWIEEMGAMDKESRMAVWLARQMYESRLCQNEAGLIQSQRDFALG